MSKKVVIIGCGNVGMSYAYALLNQRTMVNELVLIDKDIDRALGEAKDLNHGIPFGPSKIDIKAGSYEDCSDADIVMISAGANQEVGETRMDLIDKNAKIFYNIVSGVKNSGFSGIYLVATNPVDVMTYITFKYAGIDHSKVIGTGTILDTARLRYTLGDKLNISSKNIHAYVLGEHGDSEFIPWSMAKIGLEDVNQYLEKDEKIAISYEVKNMAYEIIKTKGNTSYGIGMSMVKITNAILGNELSLLTVSSYDKNNNIFYGYPTILGSDGVIERLPITLTEEEQLELEFSIKTIKTAINSLND